MLHTILIVLGAIIAVPVLLLVLLIGGLLAAEARGENPFQ